MVKILETRLFLSGVASDAQMLIRNGTGFLGNPVRFMLVILTRESHF
jgi:hypothetical protein